MDRKSKSFTFGEKHRNSFEDSLSKKNFKNKQKRMSLRMYSYRGRDIASRSFSQEINEFFATAIRLSDEWLKFKNASKHLTDRILRKVMNNSTKRKRGVEKIVSSKVIRTSTLIGDFDIDDLSSISSLNTTYKSEDYRTNESQDNTDSSSPSEISSGTEDDVSLSRFGSNAKRAIRFCNSKQTTSHFRADEYNNLNYENEMQNIGIKRDETIVDMKSITSNEDSSIGFAANSKDVNSLKEGYKLNIKIN